MLCLYLDFKKVASPLCSLISGALEVARRLLCEGIILRLFREKGKHAGRVEMVGNLGKGKLLPNLGMSASLWAVEP